MFGASMNMRYELTILAYEMNGAPVQGGYNEHHEFYGAGCRFDHGSDGRAEGSTVDNSKKELER